MWWFVGLTEVMNTLFNLAVIRLRVWPSGFEKMTQVYVRTAPNNKTVKVVEWALLHGVVWPWKVASDMAIYSGLHPKNTCNFREGLHPSPIQWPGNPWKSTTLPLFRPPTSAVGRIENSSTWLYGQERSSIFATATCGQSPGSVWWHHGEDLHRREHFWWIRKDDKKDGSFILISENRRFFGYGGGVGRNFPMFRAQYLCVCMCCLAESDWRFSLEVPRHSLQWDPWKDDLSGHQRKLVARNSELLRRRDPENGENGWRNILFQSIRKTSKFVEVPSKKLPSSSLLFASSTCKPFCIKKRGTFHQKQKRFSPVSRVRMVVSVVPVLKSCYKFAMALGRFSIFGRCTS